MSDIDFDNLSDAELQAMITGLSVASPQVGTPPRPPRPRTYPGTYSIPPVPELASYPCLQQSSLSPMTVPSPNTAQIMQQQPQLMSSRVTLPDMARDGLNPTKVSVLSSPASISAVPLIPDRSAASTDVSADPRIARALHKRTVDVCFVVDCTESMTHWIRQVKEKVFNIATAVLQHERVSVLRLAFVGYRDYFYQSSDRFVIYPFTDQPARFKEQVQSVEAKYCKGNDEPEDLLGGLDQALRLEWQSFSKVIVLIADAPCHGGREYHDLQESPQNKTINDPLRAPTLLRALGSRFNIDLTFCRIKSDTDKMIAKFREFYNDGRTNRVLKEIQISDAVDDFLPKIVARITESVNKASVQTISEKADRFRISTTLKPSENTSIDGKKTTPSVPPRPPRAYSFLSASTSSSLFCSASAGAAASSLNTSRRLFDFSLKRHSYAVYYPNFNDFSWQVLVGSGGQSGRQYFNDWFSYGWICCPGNDPSWQNVLGNGTFTSDQHLANESWCANVNEKATWTCSRGYHVEPAEADSARQTTLICAGNGMWMDLNMNTISRCVKDRLYCPPPSISDGDEICVLPSPTVTSIALDNCPSLPSSPLSLSVCPSVTTDLYINGTYLAKPLWITVGCHDCSNVQFYGDSHNVICLQDLHNDTECIEYGTAVVCSIPPMMGYQLPVYVYSGASKQAPDLLVPPTISFAPPYINALQSDSCIELSFRELQCPYETNFDVAIFGSNFFVPPSHSVSVMLGTFSSLDCSSFTESDLHQNVNCTFTANSTVPLATAIPVLVQQVAGPYNLGLGATPGIPATITFQGCPAGTVDKGGPNQHISPSRRCQSCLPGSSTNDEVNAPACYVCLPGTHAPVAGSPHCLPCPNNTYAAGAGQSRCLRCPPNSYQLSNGSTECHFCDLNQYLVLTTPSPSTSFNTSLSLPSPSCSPCLANVEAKCFPNGTIIAGPSSSYILVDQSDGTIFSAVCHSSRCMSGSICLSQDPQAFSYATNISQTQLSIINCCSINRLPANINPLCALCQEGYTEWSGTCVRCDSDHINWGTLITFIICGFIFLWLLHRLPNDLHTANVSISLYFIQMTLVFFTNQQLPAIAALFNLDLLADWKFSSSNTNLGDYDSNAFCLLPLTGMQKIILKPFMPVMFVLFLGLIYALHRLIHSCMRKRNVNGHTTTGWKKMMLLMYSFLFGEDDRSVQHYEAEMVISPKSFPPSPSPSVAFSSSTSSLNQPLLLERPEAEVAVTKSMAKQSTPPTVPYFHSLVRIGVYGYNIIALVTLSYFHCESAGDLGSFLYDEPSISCNSQSYHNLLALFLCIFIIFVLTPPIALAYLLYRYRQQIYQHIQTIYQQSNKHETDQGSILERSRDHDQPCVIHSQRAAFQVKSLNISEQQIPREEQAKEESVIAQAIPPSSPSNSSFIEQLDVLYAVYRGGSHHYAVLILLRRLILLCLFVFIPAPYTFGILTIMNGWFFTIHTSWIPYHRSKDNWMESMTLCALFVQTAVISIYPLPWLVDQPDASDNVVAILLLLALVILPLCILLCSACIDKYSECKTRKHRRV